MAGSEIYTTSLTQSALNTFVQETIIPLFDTNVYSFYITDVWVELARENPEDEESLVFYLTDESQTVDLLKTYNNPHVLMKYADSFCYATGGAYMDNPIKHFKFKPGLVLQQKKLFVGYETSAYAGASTIYVKIKGMRIPKENANVFYSKAKGLYTHVHYVPFVFTAQANDTFENTYVNLPGSKSATKDIVGIQWDWGLQTAANEGQYYAQAPNTGDTISLQVTASSQTDILPINNTDYGWVHSRQLFFTTNVLELWQTASPMTYINPKVRITNQEYAYVGLYHKNTAAVACTLYGRLVVLTYSRKG